MKKTLILATASLATASLAAALAPAAFAQPFTDNARVVSSAPVFERIPIQREECWNERERGYRERRVTRSDTGAPIGPGTVLGAIVGGVAGHQVGRGRGNDAATAAGAVVGGLLGNQYDRDRDAPPVTEVERVPVERDVQRCRTVDEVREATVGYDVRYEYRGRQFTTRLPQDPGRTLPVQVEVRPLPMRDAPPPPPPPPGPRAPTYR